MQQEQDPIAQIEYELAEVKRMLHQMVQPATVAYVYRKAGEPGIKHDRDDGTWLGYVDVIVDGQEVQRIPFKTERHGEDKTFWLPSEGEKGQLVSPSGDYKNGTFYPAIAPKRSERVIPEGMSLNQRITRYRDGTERVIDVEEHTDVYKIPHQDGVIEIHVGKVTPSLRKQENDTIEDKVGLVTKIKQTPEGIDVELNPLIKIHLRPEGITMTAPFVNIVGVLQVLGVPLIVP